MDLSLFGSAHNTTDARYPFEQASVHEGNEEEYPSYGSCGNEPARPVGVLDKRSYGGRKVDNDEKIGFADGGLDTSFFHSQYFEGRSNLPAFPPRHVSQLIGIPYSESSRRRA